MRHPLYAEMMTWPDVSLRRMFGGDCFFVNNRMFAFFWEGNFVLKLSEERYHQALTLPSVSPFIMRGVPFGKWAQFSSHKEGAENLLPWLRAAYEGVSAGPPPKRRKGRARSPGGRA